MKHLGLFHLASCPSHALSCVQLLLKIAGCAFEVSRANGKTKTTKRCAKRPGGAKVTSQTGIFFSNHLGWLKPLEPDMVVHHLKWLAILLLDLLEDE